MLISWVYYFIVMIKTIIKHYLFDMGLSIFFESVYTNMVIPRIVPVMNGQTMSIDGHNFKLVLFNLSGDTNECIKIGNEILNHVLFMHPDLVTDFIQKKFGLYSELTYFY